MLSWPKAETNVERQSNGNFYAIRNKLMAALVMGLFAAGCQNEKAADEGLTSQASSLPAMSAGKGVAPEPGKNICDEKLKTDANMAKYPRAPRKGIQVILDKFKGAETAIEDFTGNGCRETIIFIPKGFDRNKPVELQYHFHGAFGNFIGLPLPYNTRLVKKGRYGKADIRLEQALTALSYRQEQGQRNTVLVYPLSAGRREGGDEFAYDFAYDDLWMKAGNDTGDSMTVLDFEVKNKLATDFGISTDEAAITLSGHSAGGRPIQHTIESGFVPDKIRFLEASYNDWAAKTYKKLRDQGHDVPMEIYYKPGLITAGPASAFSGKENVKVIAKPTLTHGQFVELL